MPTYVLMSTLTDEGRKTVKERPDRIKEVNQELEGMGARVIGQYAVLGAYDRPDFRRTRISRDGANHDAPRNPD
jgi:uncharacterized protein with GYD domain